MTGLPCGTSRTANECIRRKTPNPRPLCRARSADSDAGELQSGDVFQLFGNNLEAGQQAGAECRAECDIGGIATAGHHDPSDSRAVVPRVKGVPAAAEKGLEPAAEIHRRV